MMIRSIVWIALAVMLAACGGSDNAPIPTLDTRLTDTAPPTPIDAVIVTEDAQAPTSADSRVILPTQEAALNQPVISVDVPAGWQQFQGSSLANESMTVLIVINPAEMQDGADYETWVQSRAESSQIEPRTVEFAGRRVDVFAQENTWFASSDLGGGYVAEASLNSMTENVSLDEYEEIFAAIVASTRIES